MWEENMGKMGMGFVCLLGLGVLSLATGCGAAADGGWETEGDAAPSEEAVGSDTEAVTGLITTSNCTGTEQQLAINAVNMGRVVASSTAFTQCVAFATNVGKELSNFGGKA